MIITRKIQLIPDGGAEERRETLRRLRAWRDDARRAANTIVSHRFVQGNIRDFLYLKEGAREKIGVKDILRDGPGMSEQNVTYRVVSGMLKGRVPSGIFSCLNSDVCRTYRERYPDFVRGKASIPSYRNIPLPFPSRVLDGLRADTDTDSGRRGFVLDFYGLPLRLLLGRDRSGNRRLIERAVSGECRFRDSRLMLDDRSGKLFLLLCVDVPEKASAAEPGKVLYASLDVDAPIVCATERECLHDPARGYRIGDREEFLHRRLAIQAAVRRCQERSTWNAGGRGRRKKTASVSRFHEKERGYIDHKTHVYSRELVRLAERLGCGIILLVGQEARERSARGSRTVLRNWSYFDLKTKIEYKARMAGIDLKEE